MELVDGEGDSDEDGEESDDENAINDRQFKKVTSISSTKVGTVSLHVMKVQSSLNFTAARSRMSPSSASSSTPLIVPHPIYPAPRYSTHREKALEICQGRAQRAVYERLGG